MLSAFSDGREEAWLTQLEIDREVTSSMSGSRTCAEKPMQELDQVDQNVDFTGRAGKSLDLPPLSQNLYTVLQQEVELGVQALSRGNADMSVTLFQSALQKLTVGRAVL